MVTMFSVGYFTVLHLVARVYLKTVVDLPSTSRREKKGEMINQEGWNKTTENNLGEPSCSYQWGSELK